MNESVIAGSAFRHLEEALKSGLNRKGKAKRATNSQNRILKKKQYIKEMWTD